MRRLYELSAKLTEARQLVDLLGVLNTPTESDARMKADIQYRLAFDAMNRAERAYQDELARTDDETLWAIANEIASEPGEVPMDG